MTFDWEIKYWLDYLGLYVLYLNLTIFTWLSWLVSCMSSTLTWLVSRLLCQFNLIILTCILHTLNFFVHLTWLSWLASYINWLHCPFNLIILTCILHTLNFFVHLSWLSWLASYIHWLLCPINFIILTYILHTLNSMFPNYVCTRGRHLMPYLVHFLFFQHSWHDNLYHLLNSC